MKPRDSVSLAALLCLAAAGSGHAEILVWGSEYPYVTNLPAGLNEVSAIAAGTTYVMALRKDGGFLIWGDPDNALPRYAHVASNGVPIVAVAAGPATCAVLREDGSASSWGDTESRYTVGPGSGTIALGCGRSCLIGLRADGTVFGYGDTGLPPAPGLTGIRAIAVYGFGLALDGSDQLLVWPASILRVLPDPGLTQIPQRTARTIAIAAGESHALALQEDGSVIGWGGNAQGQSAVPADLPKIKAIAAGRLHSLALGRDGKLYGWGDNSHGELDFPQMRGRILAIGAGCGFSVAQVADRPRLGIGRLGGDAQISLEAELGGDYGIECFENSAWRPLLSITNLEASPKMFSDPAWAGREGRFYRALMR